MRALDVFSYFMPLKTA